MKISREFKVGIIGIVSLGMLYWGFNFLKGSDLFESNNKLYAVYNRVEGLAPAKPILLNGFKVGQVDNIYFHPNGSGQLIVSLKINTEFPIPKNSRASIKSTVLGDKSISLILGESTENAIPGDTLLGQLELSLSEELNEQVAPLKNKIESLFTSVDTVLVILAEFLNDDTQDNFSESFTALKNSFKKLEGTISRLDLTVDSSAGNIVSTFKSLASITHNLDENGEELTAIFNNMESLSDSLSKIKFKQTFASLNVAVSSIEEVAEKINNGEGTAGLLINDPELYQNLSKASEQLDLLLLDLKYNPGRYIDLSLFGRRKDYNEQENLAKEAEEKKQRDGQ